MAGNPQNMYSSAAERANYDSCDDLKLIINNPLISMVYTNIFQRCKCFKSFIKSFQPNKILMKFFM